MSNKAQSVVPALTYEDGLAALEWLGRAFGLRERAEERIVMEDGRLAHAEVETEGGDSITIHSLAPGYEGPRRHREHCEPARHWSSVPWIIDGLAVYVEDVGAHYERARREGATILSELEDGPPARRYRAEDLEGHRWMFMQRE